MRYWEISYKFFCQEVGVFFLITLRGSREDLRRIALRFNNHFRTLDTKTKNLVPKPLKNLRNRGLVISENSRSLVL